jgi:NAD(P)-dependent dehydrogenase (short-subunit alcohol dehydrogenase family)
LTTIIAGINGSIGSIIAKEEAKKGPVVGTYRKYDDHADELAKNDNIELIQQDMLENHDMSGVVNRARTLGTVNKIYYLIGESWNIGWDRVSLKDIDNAIKMCALPLASLIIELKEELLDENNLMRWASVSGVSSLIFSGGPNKPATGGAKHMAEFYLKSASAFYTCKQNLFNNVVLGFSNRTKNFHAGHNGDALKNLCADNIPIGTATEPENVADMLMWLNADTNKFITGQNIVVDGGETIKTRDNATDTPMQDHPKYY